MASAHSSFLDASLVSPGPGTHLPTLQLAALEKEPAGISGCGWRRPLSHEQAGQGLVPETQNRER